jgi:branched-chain amino acid transport system substrate-binding protein
MDGGVFVGKEQYGAYDSDFTATLRKIEAAKPDVVYLADMYNVANHVQAQARTQGIRTTFIGPDGWQSEDLQLSLCEG